MTRAVHLADYSTYLRSRGFPGMKVVRTNKKPGDYELCKGRAVRVGDEEYIDG